MKKTITKRWVVDYSLTLSTKELALLDQCLRYCLHRLKTEKDAGIHKVANADMVQKFISELNQK